MTDSPRETLFGVPVEFTDKLPAGELVCHGQPWMLGQIEQDPPPGWGLMDTGQRIVALHERYPTMRFLVGSGTTEALVSWARPAGQA